MKNVLSICLFCLLLAFLPAQAAFMPFHGGAGVDDVAGVQLEDTRDGITVTLEFPGVHLEDAELDGTFYQQLNVNGCGLKGVDGEPYMPFKGVFLEVPRGVEVSATELTAKEMVLDGSFTVYPKQPAQLDCNDGTPAETVVSAKAYALDGMFPASRVHLADSGMIRGRSVVFLEVSPLQFNPAQNQLTACSEITVNVTWTGTPKPLSETRKAALYSPAFESQASRLIANYTPMTPPRSGQSRDGAEYLIICADMFADELIPLAEWKTLKGYHTTIATLSDVGGTSEAAIQAYLQNAYDTWDPVPEYVLLVGDSGQLTPGSAYGYPGNFISDLPYSCLDGSDYFADVFMGRFAVEDEAECTVVVNKVLTYDRNPVAGTWYDNFLVAAYFQDYYSPSCEADRWFFETGCLVMQYLENTIGMNPFTAGCTSASGCSQYYGRSDSYPHRPSVPSPFPTYWTDIITSASQATADIHSAFASGISLVQHRDHGEELGWADPPFYVSDVNTLTNGNMLPVVNSINCLTGAFSYSSDCFAEALQIKDGGGAVGIVASTEVSMSGYNDLITHGMFTCYYPDYDTTHTSNIYDFSKRPCEALNFGKYYMYEYEGASATYTQYEFELFHWFGDPEMQLRNTVPVPPDVVVPAAIPAGSYSVVITCNDDGARIALSQEGTILGVGFASGGTCTVNLDVPVTAGVDVTMVVTGYGLDPLEVNVPSGAVSCGSVNIVETLVNCSAEIMIKVMDADLNLSPTVADQVTINVSSDSMPAGYDITLTEIDVDIGVFENTMQLYASGGSGDLLVSHSDTITAYYYDEDCEGVPVDNYDYADVDCAGPVISNVNVTGLSTDMATVTWDTSEPASSVLYYGDSMPPGMSVSDSTMSTTHEVQLTGLTDCTQYYFSIEATDSVSNTTLDDNGGAYYSFVTYELVIMLEANMDSDPGWTYEGAWAYGVPQGNEGDPSSGYTGDNVVGYNLSGDYTNNLPETYCTTQSFDCSEAGEVFFGFYKWLGMESSTWDHASIDVSPDGGSSWTQIWDWSGSSTSGGPWEYVEYDISGIAAGNANVQIRWVMGTTDGSVTYCGWNVDDVLVSYTTECTTLPTPTPTPECLHTGDVDDSGTVTAGDAQTAFMIALGSYTPSYQEECAADCNGDGTVTAGDAQGIFMMALGSGACADPLTKSYTRPSGSGLTAYRSDIVIETRNADNGQLIADVMIEAPRQIDAFILDLQIDRGYAVVDVRPGTLDPDWLDFGWNVLDGNILAVGAYSTGLDADFVIPEGSEGSLVTITLETNGNLMARNRAPVTLIRALDDLE